MEPTSSHFLVSCLQDFFSGIIENMSIFKCPSCAHQAIIWPALTGGAEKLALELNVPLLGQVPLDPIIGRACDQGENPFVGDDGQKADIQKNEALKIYQNIGKMLRSTLSSKNWIN